jgi:putative membrane protein
MKTSTGIWTVACAAALTFACGDNANRNNNTATGTDRTSAAADRAPGTSNPASTANPAGTASPDQSANRDLGAASPMARANNAGDDHAFVEKMAQTGIAEVKLGQLAAERAADAQVKQFGRRMVTDHQKANNELKQIASKMAVQLPAETDDKHQQLYDRLSKLKGAEFDREYMKAMVDGHQEVAQELERHSDSNTRSVGTSGNASQAEASVSGWASKTLPDVRQHLEQAKQIEAKVSTAKPAATTK